MATRIKAPRIGDMMAGCDRLAPFLMTAEKQPIWVCVEFEYRRIVAYPSKSGILSAITGIPETSDGETGMIASAVIGTLALIGHKL